MSPTTASAVIALATGIEHCLAEFYACLAEKPGSNKDLMLRLAKESRKNERLINRVYYGAITDALEACFSFNGVELEAYALDLELGEEKSYADAIAIAMDAEETVTEFYRDMAQKTRVLIGDLPLVFDRLAEARQERRRSLAMCLRR